MAAWAAVSSIVMRVISPDDRPIRRKVARRFSRPDAPSTAAWAVSETIVGTRKAQANSAMMTHMDMIESSVPLAKDYWTTWKSCGRKERW